MPKENYDTNGLTSYVTVIYLIELCIVENLWFGGIGRLVLGLGLCLLFRTFELSNFAFGIAAREYLLVSCRFLLKSIICAPWNIYVYNKYHLYAFSNCHNYFVPLYRCRQLTYIIQVRVFILYISLALLVFTYFVKYFRELPLWNVAPFLLGSYFVIIKVCGRKLPLHLSCIFMHWINVEAFKKHPRTF